MKYCNKCGSQLDDSTSFCANCGAPATQQSTAEQQPYNQQPYNQQPSNQQQNKQPSALSTVAKVFMILSTVGMGFYIIPLAWCIPMTVSYFKKVKNHEPVSTGFKVCTLLFVNLISGILMLCDNDN